MEFAKVNKISVAMCLMAQSINCRADPSISVRAFSALVWRNIAFFLITSQGNVIANPLKSIMVLW